VIMALKPSTMDLETGKVTLILGPSGSGKTTLLSLIGCVIYPSSGELNIDGVSTRNLSANKMAKIGLNKIGFVFQQFNLLAPLSSEHRKKSS
jgi:putative ABC transport system ATP-binding protein